MRDSEFHAVKITPTLIAALALSASFLKAEPIDCIMVHRFVKPEGKKFAKE